MIGVLSVESPAQFLRDIGVGEHELLVSESADDDSYSMLPLRELDDAVFAKTSLSVRLGPVDETSKKRRIRIYDADGGVAAMEFIRWSTHFGYEIYAGGHSRRVPHWRAFAGSKVEPLSPGKRAWWLLEE